MIRVLLMMNSVSAIPSPRSRGEGRGEGFARERQQTRGRISQTRSESIIRVTRVAFENRVSADLTTKLC
jgi:hypothetical protein